MEQQKQSHPILYSCLALIVLAIIGFLCLVMYYAWVQKYGTTMKKNELYTKFRQKSQDIPQITYRISDISTPISPMIHPHNPSFGKEDAPITLLIFIDFDCPFCKKAVPGVHKLMAEYKEPVRFVFKQLPVEYLHPEATKAAIAAQCAHEQKVFLPYYDALFANPDRSEETLLLHAENLGLNTKTFRNCLSSPHIARQIEKDLQDAITLDIAGTPAYSINQKKIEGEPSATEWKTLIIDSLQ